MHRPPRRDDWVDAAKYHAPVGKGTRVGVGLGSHWRHISCQCKLFQGEMVTFTAWSSAPRTAPRVPHGCSAQHPVNSNACSLVVVGAQALVPGSTVLVNLPSSKATLDTEMLGLGSDLTDADEQVALD
jgi:hypothetical protein